MSISYDRVAPRDVNDSGDIVGHVEQSSFRAPFLYSGGTTAILSGIDVVRAINNSGQIVGATENDVVVNLGSACLYNSDGSTVSVPISGYESTFSDINNSGMAVGYGFTADQSSLCGFVYDSNTDNVTMLSGTDGSGALAFAINDIGLIVGGYYNLSTLESYLCMWKLNDDGSVSSAMEIAHDASEFLIMYPGFCDINDNGVCVGRTYKTYSDKVGIAYIPGVGVVDLNDLVDTGDWIIEYASSVNDSNVITGFLSR